MTAEQIAAGLTKAGKKALLTQPCEGHYAIGGNSPEGYACASHSATFNRLSAWGLIKRCGSGVVARLTPLGLEVRRILQETPDAQ